MEPMDSWAETAPDSARSRRLVRPIWLLEARSVDHKRHPSFWSGCPWFEPLTAYLMNPSLLLTNCQQNRRRLPHSPSLCLILKYSTTSSYDASREVWQELLGEMLTALDTLGFPQNAVTLTATGLKPIALSG